MANPYGQGYGAPPAGYGPPPGAGGQFGGQPGFQPPPQHAQGPPGFGMQPPGLDPQVAQWFQTVDQDRSGQINAHELRQALTNANWTQFNPETCRLMIGMFDRDNSGTIDMNEFAALWKYIQEWKQMFDGFDRDRSGFIDATELSNALGSLGYRLSPQFAHLIVTRYDQYAKSRMSLDNFIQACVLLKSITDTFKQKDTQMTGNIRIGYEEFLTMVMLNKP